MSDDGGKPFDKSAGASVAIQEYANGGAGLTIKRRSGIT